MSYYLNNPIDISSDFSSDQDYFIPGKIIGFDKEKCEGKVQWNYHRYALDWFFNKIDKHLQLQLDKNAPFQDYEIHPVCNFSISFIGERTLRVRMKTTNTRQEEHASLMLDGPLSSVIKWKLMEDSDAFVYQSAAGVLQLKKETFGMEVKDVSGKILFRTQGMDELKAMHSKAMPFSFMRRTSDYSRSLAASFSLSPGERIYGGGESFTSLNKRGQKMILWTADAQSSASTQQYKPIPFFLSDRGYGMFVHTSSPVCFDFGHTHQGSNTLFVGEDQLDLFIFMGSPAEILGEYTSLTGRSPLPPLWSFGLWMSRFSYRSQDEVKQVAGNLRKYTIPCDVIHIDAGWFRKGINCDFEFCRDKFPDPEKMISDLRQEGFRTSLWQIPYFTPLNPVFEEVVEKKLFVKDGNGNVPTEDAILDFSNDKTIAWYKEKIKALFDKGVSVIKADFGEAAPYNGYYSSGRSGFYEHNLYPLRYNQLVSGITSESTGEAIIWARSAWAGSQRYPLHWGGDAEVSDAGMSGTLRGGLSFGLSGFSFWSHDIGGFSGSPKEELFLRWAFFGLLSSHSRVHGFPPREPWEFSESFQETFRKIVELRYRLMPYIFTQASMCSEKGLPMVRPLFLNYPDDATCWMIEDQYLFGNDLLVAPLMEENMALRNVYLPEGKWINYASKKIYDGGEWHTIEAGELPGILVVRFGSIIPHIPLASSTAFMNWNEVELIAFAADEASGQLLLPDSKDLISLHVNRSGKGWECVGSGGFRVVSFEEI